jgi:hypothetical protein
MQDVSILKARDLSPAAKEAFEAILGRNLRDDEEVGIWTSRPLEAPTGQARKEAWRDLNQHLDHIASKARDLPDEEMEKLVDDVWDEVRHGRQ